MSSAEDLVSQAFHVFFKEINFFMESLNIYTKVATKE
jgi:hypothetical protein